ncbi:MAG: hypothetical protein H8K06_06005 [Nitrospira sp.]|uniref:DUF5666 domain-containing protein n=1 Tax=Nitrospira defluvii TaxID=330214 RepID=A0ABM8QJB0_9BACT|nr:DUF5666 domain-containing protein [Nitrospira defluvii]MCS6326627.1 hypothetical protein [Nitrospira sp.]CAE6699050.1 conserved exported hypothetical protein [Nitrospira defluvii]
MTFLRLMLAALLFLSAPAFVAAHGSGQHVLGVVAAIDSTHIEVKTPKGQVVSVRLTDKTQYKVRNLRRPKSPPQVGDRVVVEAEKGADGLTATEVHYSDSQPKAAQ